MDKKIEETIKVLNKGGIVIFPTDTAYGIGCRIDNGLAVKRLFELRKRPSSQAVPVLVSSIEMAKKYLQQVPIEVEERLMKKYWPGPLTIVLKSRNELVPSLVRGGGETLGVRMPNNKTTLEIIESIGVPLLGPSANFSGQKTPYSVFEIDEKLINLVDFVLEGETKEKDVSTVIDCSGSSWKILRQGVIKI